jgi:hypothetical protein
LVRLGLQVLESDPNSSERSGLRNEVEAELSSATKKIANLLRQLDEVKDHPGSLSELASIDPVRAC